MKIELIDQADEEQMDKMKRFAASFNHRLERADWPLYLVHHEGKPLGYFHLVVTSIIHPAMSDKCTPRETYDMINEVRARVEAMGPTAAVLVPNGHSNFTDKMMEQLGFFSTKHTLWTTVPPT